MLVLFIHRKLLSRVKSLNTPIRFSRTYADCNCGWGGYSRIGFGAYSKNFQGYGTVEEDELLVKLEREDARKSVSPLKAKVSTPKKTKTTKAKGSTSQEIR